ncbi:MAG: DUF4214 domain-containing protein [Pseudomonadota bacterium]
MYKACLLFFSFLFVSFMAIAANAGTNTVSLDADDWEKTGYIDAWQAPATVTNTAEGHLRGTKTTATGGQNWILGIHGRCSYNFQNATLRYKWKLNGQGGYCGIYSGVDNDSGFIAYNVDPNLPYFGGLTTNHSWNGSEVMESDTWYYTEFIFSSIGYNFTVSKTGYGDTDFLHGAKTGDAAWFNSLGDARVFFQMGDNYTAGAYFEVAEISISSPAAPTPRQFIEGIYVAYWGRAADPEGLDYWEGLYNAATLDFAGIAENFASSPEGTSAYEYFDTVFNPSGNPITDSMRQSFVEAIYQNLFDRAPDAGGLAYWVDILKSGAVTPGVFIATIINAAYQGRQAESADDWNNIDVKIQVTEYYTRKIVASGIDWTAAIHRRQAADVLDGINRDSDICASKLAIDEDINGMNAFQFYAVYEKLADNSIVQSIGQGIDHSAMSADGKVVAFLTNGGGNLSRVYVCGSDGSNLTFYEPEVQAKNLGGLAINEDGSRIFVMAPYVPAIYKIENGAVSKIDLAVEGGPGGINYPIRTTASGEYAYFIAGGDLWRVHQSGSEMTKIINDTEVPFNGGVGHSIQEYAISADGGTILFRFWGYWLNGVEHGLCELFIYRGGTPTQITTDTLGKERLGISQDGSKIVFAKSYKWYSSDSSGGNIKELGPAASSQSPAMTYDGSKIFGHDFGGRMIHTDGSGQLDLLGGWPLYFSTPRPICTSKDGTHLLFQSDEMNNWGVFYGHLNDPAALSTAPRIHSITFEPAAMVRNNAAARVTLRAAITSPNGVSDLKTVGQYSLLSGISSGITGNVPVYFYNHPLDNGADPDTVAGDGIFSSLGSPGNEIDQYDEMTVRVGVTNSNRNIFTFADTLLPVVDSLPGIVGTSSRGGEN